MSQPKIFGIGLAKTGTTSLNEALRILGYSTIDYPLGLRGVEEHDAATDAPIADRFELLDRKYPGSKFIYTVRQRDEWLRSCKTHWDRSIDGPEEAVELRKRLYGTAEFDADLYVKAYARHEQRVLNYFMHRQDDLLLINICSNENDWEPLCSFLEKEIPDCPFPHVNKAKNLLEYHLGNIVETWIPARARKQTRRIKRKTIRIFSHRQSTS